MKLENIKCVLFDLDDTLWDFHGNMELALKFIYEKYMTLFNNIVPNFDLFLSEYAEINAKLWADYRTGLVKKEFLMTERYKITYNKFGINLNDDTAMIINNDFLKKLGSYNYCIDGAIDILDYLIPKYKLGIITNGFKFVQEDKLKNSGLGKYFNFLITSEECGVLKPNKMIFEYALEKTGCKSNEAVYIGDEFESDIIGSNNAGIHSIWYNRKKDSFESNYKYIEIFKLSEIKNYL